LCEVQGYVYEARRRAAELAAVLGHVRRAEELDRQAETLRERFEHAFWCEELGTYALALDGDKRPCRVRASNAGHCLFTGIAGRDRARRAAETLLADDAFSGWGIRTVSAAEVRYNPMSYHNGSVWPHDNALIAHGLARYGFQDLVLKVMTGFFDASLFVDLHRLPELFCGFHRRPGEGPTLYPVACAPQSWAAASVFMLLQACLGLGIRAPQAQICFSHPVLPAFLKEVCIRDLEVGDGSVDFLLQRRDHDVGINVLRRQGNVAVAVAL
jgi:glycogen debranching enzyme